MKRPRPWKPKPLSRKKLRECLAGIPFAPWAAGDLHARHPDDGWTLLHYFSANADMVADPYGTFEALLEAGVDINAQDHQGWTFLLTIIPWSTAPVVRHYLERGASPNLADHTGTTPLMQTFGVDGYEPALDTAEVLLQAGADVHARLVTGESALDIAREFAETCADDSFLKLFEKYSKGNSKGEAAR